MSDTNERSVASDGSVAGTNDRLLAAVQADAPMPRALLVSAAAEIERLRFVIRRLAEQDATLSVCNGNVTVTMNATLTDAEREALTYLSDGESPFPEEEARLAVVRSLLEKHK